MTPHFKPKNLLIRGVIITIECTVITKILKFVCAVLICLSRPLMAMMLVLSVQNGLKSIFEAKSKLSGSLTKV